MSVSQILHASCVSVAGKGLLILGRSGAGKSSLALQLMAFGAMLVADDRTEIWKEQGQIWAQCPIPLKGLIESRSIGLLASPALERVQIDLTVDLDQSEAERLPPFRHMSLLETRVALVHGKENPHLAPALLQYLRYGRQH